MTLALRRFGAAYVDGVELSLRGGKIHAYDYDSEKGRTLCGKRFDIIGWIDNELVEDDKSLPDCIVCRKIVEKERAKAKGLKLESVRPEMSDEEKALYLVVDHVRADGMREIRFREATPLPFQLRVAECFTRNGFRLFFVASADTLVIKE